MENENYKLTLEQVNRYLLNLQEQERSQATIQKYAHEITSLYTYLKGESLTKARLIEWKKSLTEKYAPTTVNCILTAINGFLRFMRWEELTIKLLKIQKLLFRSENRELSQAEYIRLVHAAEEKENERLSLMIQTICVTGIRISELKYITVEAVYTGYAEVCNKGKRRIVFLPSKLCRLLKRYIQKQKITAGAVFITRTGRPVDRSNIWREMKGLSKSAGVKAEKVFPHNLRHLFARTFYTIEKDLSRLADILGHSNISTTRIYTAESGKIHQKQIERMGLIVTT